MLNNETVTTYDGSVLFLTQEKGHQLNIVCSQKRTELDYLKSHIVFEK